ncbi:MAG: hypothetical protein L0H79_20750 [Intrasporangium sp.]|uniref:hypothetical protein n=1 Tax=Intrasporangium sp. TaxID=1925024 RepID=UPI002647438F|nr:hypothetical protein [Intrasporangium sp.]MDN5798157.1 hypothetical protein [Intrasporangium sp.]
MTASTTGKTNHVLQVLSLARLQVTSARARLHGLHAGVAEASRALTRAQAQTRMSAREGEPGRLARSQAAAQEMGSARRSCRSFAGVGITIAGELKKAALMAQDAGESVRGIDQEGSNVGRVFDLAALRARADALGDALKLALPMATAASEHLYGAAHAARGVSRLDLDERARLTEVDRAGTGAS